MKKFLILMVMTVFCVSGIGMVWAGEKAPQKVVDLAGSTLVKLGTDSVIVTAVKADNAKGKSLDQIKEIAENVT